MINSSLNSSKNMNGSQGNIKHKSRSNQREKSKKLKSIKKQENLTNLYLKHSMSSGSFNKILAYDKPLLKTNRSKYHNKFMVERKQINLQSNPRKSSKPKQNSISQNKIQPVTLSKSKTSKNIYLL